MSSDEQFLVQLLRAAAQAGLEIIIVGSTAGVLHGAPIMTQDVDLLVRDSPRNREKLTALAELLHATVVCPSPLSTSLKLVGLDIPVDVLFDALPSGQTFAALRARGTRMDLAGETAVYASLEDVIASKEAAGRPKDRAQLETLRATLAVLRAREQEGP